MSGSAELARAAIMAAISQLQNVRMEVIGAKSQVSEMRIYLGTAKRATLDARMAQTRAAMQLEEAIQMTERGLLGSANNNASAALVWLHHALDDIKDDLLKINGAELAIDQRITETNGITTNHEEEILSLNGAISELQAHLTLLG